MVTAKNSKIIPEQSVPDAPDRSDDREIGITATESGPHGALAQKSEELLRKALRSSSDSITVSRLNDGRFIDVNEQFEKTTGYNRADVVGKTSLELGLWKKPDDRSRLERLLRRDGVARNFETEFVGEAGEIRQCVVSAEVLEIEEERCMLATVRDVTDTKRAEEALRWLNERLQNERQSLVEKDAALKQVLGYMEEEKSAFHSEVTSHVSDLLEPIIAKLRDHGGRLDPKDVDLLERNLKRIVETEIDGFQESFSKLTGREMEICAAIKSGLSSKEIADQFGVSVNTVNKHRQFIRRKLQIDNRDVNLAAYLRSR
jgi:PAS domain S-box-containing protein